MYIYIYILNWQAVSRGLEHDSEFFSLEANRFLRHIVRLFYILEFFLFFYILEFFSLFALTGVLLYTGVTFIHYTLVLFVRNRAPGIVSAKVVSTRMAVPVSILKRASGKKTLTVISINNNI